MEAGLFLLLCLVALVIGTRARSSKYKQLSDREQQRKKIFQRVITWIALIIMILFLLMFIPFVIQDVRIAMDTHFVLTTYLSIVLLVFGLFTVYTIVKAIKKKRDI